jgi:hypothetical protein
MLHIIGLNHRAQARTLGNELTREQQVFSNCLLRTIGQARPVFVAEEDCEEALAGRGRTSIAKEIADQAGIEHRFCDPSRAQRQAFGYRDGQSLELQLFMSDNEGLSNDEIFRKARAIEIGRYFPIRERFWLERLGGCCDVDAIFICGDLHIESFGRILDISGIAHRVVERGIGVTEEDARFNLAVAYLAEHPELADVDLENQEENGIIEIDDRENRSF